MTYPSQKKTKFISVVDACTCLGQLLDEVQKGEPYLIIEHKGGPFAAILSIEGFRVLSRYAL